MPPGGEQGHPTYPMAPQMSAERNVAGPGPGPQPVHNVEQVAIYPTLGVTAFPLDQFSPNTRQMFETAAHLSGDYPSVSSSAISPRTADGYSSFAQALPSSFANTPNRAHFGLGNPYGLADGHDHLNMMDVERFGDLHFQSSPSASGASPREGHPSSTVTSP